MDVLHAYVRSSSGRLRLAQLETYQARYVDGLTLRGVAGALGISFLAVKKRLERLRAAARRWYARLTGTHSIPSSDDGGSSLREIRTT